MELLSSRRPQNLLRHLVMMLELVRDLLLPAATEAAVAASAAL